MGPAAAAGMETARVVFGVRRRGGVTWQPALAGSGRSTVGRLDAVCVDGGVGPSFCLAEVDVFCLCRRDCGHHFTGPRLASA